ncbi:MAG: tRNA threonylcarbamoyladenosine dehydratase [Muribaculaceae bacterium]|nr:tRNA threonylcarbamoyladenosine dehydratase [Muribaculaceae bacterium]
MTRHISEVSDEDILSRSRRILGDDALGRLGNIRVILFGVGGVGSWCAESLVRSGVRHITIVDSDRVSPGNINRQLMATVETIGDVKVEALKRHLLTVAPAAEIDAVCATFSEETADEFALDSYDYIIDAIDSLKDKVTLIEVATRTRAKFFSSMGAALKMDPTRVGVAEFRNVKGCPLARALRQRFKKLGRWPSRKFLCVYSDELLPNLGPAPEITTPESGDPYALTWDARKAQINGSLMHITALFGLTLAGLVIQSVYKK